MANGCKEKIYAHKNKSSDHDSGYDLETHFFLNSGSFVAAVARPARRPWTGPEYEEYEDLNAHLRFISAGLPLAQLRLG